MKKYNLLLALTLATMILGSCGSSKYGTLKLVKTENSKSAINLSNAGDISDFSKKEDLKIISNTSTNQLAKGESLISLNVNPKSIQPEIKNDRIPSAKNQIADSSRVLTWRDIKMKEQSKKLSDYNDDQSLNNKKARKLVTYSVFSYFPVLGIIFSLNTFIKAKIELARIENNPTVYSGKRKIMLARKLALTAMIIGLSITVVILVSFLILIMLA